MVPSFIVIMKYNFFLSFRHQKQKKRLFLQPDLNSDPTYHELGPLPLSYCNMLGMNPFWFALYLQFEDHQLLSVHEIFQQGNT